jgi:hypothetical protein
VARTSSHSPRNILVLPSGGAFGVVSALFLAEIEDSLKTPTHLLFDEIWCSSVGSMIAALVSSKTVATHSPLSASEVVHFLKKSFSTPFHASRVLKNFEKILGIKCKLSDSLVPIRIVTAEVTRWHFSFIPRKTEIAILSGEKHAHLALVHAVRSSCSLPGIHRTQKLQLNQMDPSSAFGSFIDAGHILCGAQSVMNPILAVQSAQPELLLNPHARYFFVGNGWARSFHSSSLELIDIFPVDVELKPVLKKWSRTPLGVLAKQAGIRALYNLASIGAFPLKDLIQLASHTIQESQEFQNILRALEPRASH